MATLSSEGSTPAEGVEAHPDYRCHATVHVAMIREMPSTIGADADLRVFSTYCQVTHGALFLGRVLREPPHTPVVLRRGVQVIPVAARI